MLPAALCCGIASSNDVLAETLAPDPIDPILIKPTAAKPKEE